MGIGRSPAAKARAGLPRANPNDVRVKGFENHAERMSTLFRPDSAGSDPTRRGSRDLAAGDDDDDDDDDLDFIRHAKEAARRLRELNARNAAAGPPPRRRWTAARAKISATARIAGSSGAEPGSLRPPSGGNKVHPASTPSSVRSSRPPRRRRRGRRHGGPPRALRARVRARRVGGSVPNCPTSPFSITTRTRCRRRRAVPGAVRRDGPGPGTPRGRTRTPPPRGTLGRRRRNRRRRRRSRWTRRADGSCRTTTTTSPCRWRRSR